MLFNSLFPNWHLTGDHAHDFCVAALSTLPLFGLAYLIQNRDQLNSLDDPKTDSPAQVETSEARRARASELGHMIVFFAAFSVATTLAALGALLRPGVWLLAAVLLMYSLTAFLLFSRVGSLAAMALMDLLPQPEANTTGAASVTWRGRYEGHALNAVVTLPWRMLIELSRAYRRPGKGRRKTNASPWIGSAVVLGLLWLLVVIFTLFMIWIAIQMLWRTSILGSSSFNT